MKYALEENSSYKLKSFEKGYDTYSLKPSIIVRYNSLELVNRVKSIEELLKVAYGDLEILKEDVIFGSTRKLEDLSINGKDCLNELIEYSESGKKERKHEIMTFEFVYRTPNTTIMVSNDKYEENGIRKDLQGLGIVSAGSAAILLGPLGLIAVPFLGYAYIDACARELSEGRFTGMKISIAENKEKYDIKTAMKHDALCMLLEKYDPAKSDKSLVKLQKEIAKIDKMRASDFQRLKSIHGLKNTIDKTGKGNKRKNILKGFKWNMQKM